MVTFVTIYLKLIYYIDWSIEPSQHTYSSLDLKSKHSIPNTVTKKNKAYNVHD